MTRALPLLSCALLAMGLNALALGQGSLFTSMRPDVMIIVDKHPTMGTDLITVTPLNPKYSEELARSQATDLGEILQSPPRGMQVESTNPIPGNDLTKAFKLSFGVDGLIDRAAGRMGLQALAQAFASSPVEGVPNGLMIQFRTEAPTDKIVRQYSVKDVLQLEAMADQRFGIEYRIKLLTTDRSKIVIPEGGQTTPAAPPTKVAEQGVSWWIIAVSVVAAIAVGALVYSLLLRPRPRAR